MKKDLDEINLVYNGQKLGIRVDFKDPAFQVDPIFSDHDINLKITCLSLNPFPGYFIDLNDFPKLETFYGECCELRVDPSHPSLKTVILNLVTFSTLPINLIKLFAINCKIRMIGNHPKLEALKVLSLKSTQLHFDFTSLFRVVWNDDLKHFSYTIQWDRDDDEYRMIMEEDEVLTMVGPQMTSLGFPGPISARIPTLLRSLYSLYGGSLQNLTTFTQMSSLTLWEPSGDINDCKLPPNLINLTLHKPRGIIGYNFSLPASLRKLSIQWAQFEDLEEFFPPEIVDLELACCEIELTDEWLKPARLKRLSLETNAVLTFKAFLPCCEHLCLSDNSLTELQIEAPVLEYINLTGSNLKVIPKLPDSLQVLVMRFGELELSQISELPPNLKVLDLFSGGIGAFQNYTFPSSIQELHLKYLNLSCMSGVKFAKGSRLRELDMGYSNLMTINNRMIELPLGLNELTLYDNDLQNIDDLTIPQTVTFLDLSSNKFSSLKVKSHIETLSLKGNSALSGLTIPKDLELRALDLKGLDLINCHLI